MDINLSSLSKNLKLLYLLTFEEELYKNFKLEDINIKMFAHKKNYNIYRYDKFLNNRINPNHFFNYYKDSFYRSKFNNSQIHIIEKINDKEWIEEHLMYEKKYKIKIICNEYQIVAYILNTVNIPIFELFTFKIREIDNKYLLRLEMAFHINVSEQETKLKNEIILINKFENVILQNVRNSQ